MGISDGRFLEIQTCAEADAGGGDAGMIQVGKAFYEVQPQDVEDIINAYATFQVGLVAQHIGGVYSVIQGGEFHLGGVESGIVLIPDATEEDLACYDFPETEPFQSRYLVEKKSPEKMFHVEAGIVVANEFCRIHQVIGVEAIVISGIGRMDD